MSQFFQLKLADIVLFWDDRFPSEPGAAPPTGDVNRVAVVVGDSGALFIGKSLLGRRIERIPLQVIPSLPNVHIRRTPHHKQGEQIASYFLAHQHSPTSFLAGLAALRQDNLAPFQMGSMFPKRPRYESDSDYEDAWNAFAAALKPMDAIFTVDTSSRLSRFIAWATGGEWSHVLSYLGDGKISEVLTTGIRRGSIELYKNRKYWIAAHRHVGAITKPASQEEAERADRVAMGRFRPDRYNYRMATYYGCRAFFNDHTHALVPNSQIYSGTFAFIAQV